MAGIPGGGGCSWKLRPGPWPYLRGGLPGGERGQRRPGRGSLRVRGDLLQAAAPGRAGGQVLVPADQAEHGVGGGLLEVGADGRGLAVQGSSVDGGGRGDQVRDVAAGEAPDNDPLDVVSPI